MVHYDDITLIHDRIVRIENNHKFEIQTLKQKIPDLELKNIDFKEKLEQSVKYEKQKFKQKIKE